MVSLCSGDCFGDSWPRFPFPYLSPLRSQFLTNTGGYSVVSVGSLRLSGRFHGSFWFSSFWGQNYLYKPPWQLLYNFATLRFFSLPSPFSAIPNTMSDSLCKSVHDLNLDSDDEPVGFPRDLVSRAVSLYGLSIVVSPANPRKQNLRALMGHMPRVWGLPNSCFGPSLCNDRVQFRFQTEEFMNFILQRGPWPFNDWMLLTHRYYPNIDENELKICPIWVHVQGIPLLYLTIAMTQFVGSHIGHIMDVDYDDNVKQVGSGRVRLAWITVSQADYLHSMETKIRVTNVQRRIGYYITHGPDTFQATYQCFCLIRVMRQAFGSFIYKMLARYKYMKRGLNRYYLLPVRLLLESRVTSTSSSKLGFNFLYLFQWLYLIGFMYHVSCKTLMK